MLFAINQRVVVVIEIIIACALLFRFKSLTSQNNKWLVNPKNAIDWKKENIGKQAVLADELHIYQIIRFETGSSDKRTKPSGKITSQPIW
ncbi:hypothetical protein GCM10028807_49280 [Spirosoma daeguense]